MGNHKEKIIEPKHTETCKNYRASSFIKTLQNSSKLIKIMKSHQTSPKKHKHFNHATPTRQPSPILPQTFPNRKNERTPISSKHQRSRVFTPTPGQRFRYMV